MARYINRDKFMQNLKTDKFGFTDTVKIGIALDKAAADVAPIRKGKWKPYHDYFTQRQVGWICTNCSVVIRDLSNGDTDYCPYCGAMMETEEE